MTRDLSGWGYFKLAMNKYADFTGRARRSEFWWFTLFSMIFNGVGEVIDSATGFPVLGGIISLVFFIPSLAISARRLHDIGKSGWWYLLVFTIIGIFVLIAWWAQNGTRSDNKWGSSPKYGGGHEVTDHLIDDELV